MHSLRVAVGIRGGKQQGADGAPGIGIDGDDGRLGRRRHGQRVVGRRRRRRDLRRSGVVAEPVLQLLEQAACPLAPGFSFDKIRGDVWNENDSQFDREQCMWQLSILSYFSLHIVKERGLP